MISKLQAGTLYIIATPIGNLEDISLRALRLLKEVDFIAAEDTRHTRKLLSHFGLNTPLISYYREKEHQRAESVVELLQQGKNVGLVTDAGTPAISDPGAVLVQKCVDADITVCPVPGPSALTAALSCAGIEQGPILFHGFAPVKTSQRKKLLKALVNSQNHTVFYESPKRIEGFLKDACSVLGDRRAFMARELTKNFEEIMHGSLQEFYDKRSEIQKKGEFVVIIGPGKSGPPEDMDLDSLIRWYRDNTSLSLKDCSKTLADDLGISRSDIYKRALEIWKE